MAEIRIKTFLPDGTESGEMIVNPSNMFVSWTVSDFKKFLKIVEQSDETAGTTARNEIAMFFYAHLHEWTAKFIRENSGKNEDCFNALFSGDFKKMRDFVKPKKIIDEFEKMQKLLKITSEKDYSDFLAFLEEQKADYFGEERKGPEILRGESNMNEMKLHKIRGIDSAVCTAEQKIAYNLTLAYYKHANDFATAGDFADWCMKMYHPENAATKYNRQAIRQAIVNGFMQYLDKPFIASDYTKIGAVFTVADCAEKENTEIPKTGKEEKPMKENTNAAVQATEATPETVPAVVIEPEEETANGAKWTEYLENDCQFYPTPAEIAEKLARLIDWKKVKSVLEPSAGKGDLMQAVKAARKVFTWADSNGEIQEISEPAFKGEFDCVEIAPELCAILESKGYSPENADFLEWNCLKYYDAIIMNPPFAGAEKHVLKALELLKTGGQLAAIVNAETIKNPCNVYRKDLSAKLAEYGAKIEYLDGAFSTAERKTNVSIAMIYVNIPEKQCTYDYFAKMDTAHTYNTGTESENHENTELATNDIIANLLTSYKNEAQASLYILRKWRSISGLVPELSLQYAADRYTGSPYAVEANKLLEKIRLKYWKKLFFSGKVQEKLTESTRDNFRKKIETFGKYEFTSKNIYTLLGELTENLAGDIEHDMLSLWDRLTYHSSMYKNTNIHLYNGWKTNDAYKIGDKIVWDICAHRAYNDKNFVYYHDTFIQYLDELDKIFQYLNGGKRPTPDSRAIVDIFRGSVTGTHYSGEKMSFPFFYAVFYKKGTAHITFKNPDLVKKWNIFAGKKHNFLPNDYGKKCYNDLNKSEKETADSFEGKEQYQETNRNYAFYAGGASVAMLGMSENAPEQPTQAEPEKKPEVWEQNENGTTKIMGTASNGETVCIAETRIVDISEPVESPVETAPEESETEEKPEEIAAFTVGAEYGKADIKFFVESIKNNHVKIMIDGKNRVMLKRVSGGAECVKISGVEISAHDTIAPTEPPTSPTDVPEDDSTSNYTPETESPSERQEQPEIMRFEIGKIYGTVHTTNSDYMSCYKCIGRTDKTIILENSSGEKIRKRPSLTEHCIDGQKITCETVFPQGCYSMCLVLDASDIITGAESPKQVETAYFQAQAQTKRNAPEPKPEPETEQNFDDWGADFEPVDGLENPDEIGTEEPTINNPVDDIIKKIDSMSDGEFKNGAKWAIMQLLGIDQPETAPTITCTNGGAKITMTAGGH